MKVGAPRLLIRAWALLCQLEFVVAAALVVAIPTLLLLQIIFRQLGVGGLPWAEEMLRFMFLWLVYTASCVGIQKNQHFRLSFVVDRFPKAVKKGISLLVYLLWMFFNVVVVYYSILLLDRMGVQRQLSPILRINMKAIYIIIPVVFAVQIGHLLVNVRSCILGNEQESGMA